VDTPRPSHRTNRTRRVPRQAGFEQQFIHNYQIVWSKAPVSLRRTALAAPESAVDTSTMLMAWCFLSGLAAGKYWHSLWAVPLAAAAFGAIGAAAQRAAPAALDGPRRAAFVRSAVSAVFAALAVALLAAGSAGVAIPGVSCAHNDAAPVAFSLSDPLGAAPGAASNALLALWCGFSVWALFDGVRSRVGLRESAAKSGMAASTVALCCASVCLAKQLLVPYVALVLVSEVHSFFMHLLDLAALLGRRPALLRAAHAAALAVTRVGGHALLATKARARPPPAAPTTLNPSNGSNHPLDGSDGSPASGRTPRGGPRTRPAPSPGARAPAPPGAVALYAAVAMACTQPSARAALTGRCHVPLMICH
jgi:hypothetical protein